MQRRQRVTGQWFVSAEGTRWFFDAGAVSLDFVHTGGVPQRPEWEQLRASRDVARWLAGRVDGYDGLGSAPRTALAQAVELRGAVHRLARDAAEGRTPQRPAVDVVNAFAQRPDVPRTLPGGTGASRPSSVLRALSSVARDAVDVFDGRLDRVRECGADDCPLVFVDLSRQNNRRWCSMSRCGNRHKVRSHRARALDTGAGGEPRPCGTGCAAPRSG